MFKKILWLTAISTVSAIVASALGKELPVSYYVGATVFVLIFVKK